MTKVMLRRCVDTRLYKHAEASQWKTNDPRCSWTFYKGSSACDVIENSPFNNIHFIGDSLNRNMFATLVMLLSDEPMQKAWDKGLMSKLDVRCTSDTYYHWLDCRNLFGNFKKELNGSKLCGGRKPNFDISNAIWHSVGESENFRKFMNSIQGKPNTLLVIGVGAHMAFDPDIVINQFLDPALQGWKMNRLKYPNKSIWPQIIFVLPMRGSLLKPPVHIPYQDNRKLPHFASRLSDYCAASGITLMDFRQLGDVVHSFDGTHYGNGVNVMKNQIFLNHLSKITNSKDIGVV